MSSKILYETSVTKEDIPALPKTQRERIRRAIDERLRTNSEKFGKPLKHDMQGYKRLRVGDYRIIYRIEKDAVKIFKIGRRKEVYE